MLSCYAVGILRFAQNDKSTTLCIRFGVVIKHRMKKFLILIFVLMIAIFGSWVLNYIQCFFISCVEDVSMPPLEHVLGPIVIAIYSIFTLGIIFPSGLFLQKRFSIWFSAVIPTVIMSFLVSALLYVPEVDDFVSMLSFFGWLAIPWFFCSIAGLAIWPRNDIADFNGDINE